MDYWESNSSYLKLVGESIETDQPSSLHSSPEFPQVSEGKETCFSQVFQIRRSYKMNLNIPKTGISLLIITLIRLHTIPYRNKQGLAGEVN